MSRTARRGIIGTALACATLLLSAAPGSTDGGDWWSPPDRPVPDSQINVSGAPMKGTDAQGDVRGWADVHNHLMSNEGFGGRLLCGKPFSSAGVADALQDCPEHYPNGSGATFENLTGGSPGTHDPVGWPTFKDWPSHKSLTHQQTYYAWVERSWRSGQRVMVNHLGTNGVLCSMAVLVPRDRGCNEMDAVRLQAQKTYEMQEYIDSVFGGPGKGFFRVVTTPAQATEVIKAGKLAVILGVETSEPFGCKQVLDVAQCSKADIDRGLDELHALGVRTMFVCHKFDNALCGVRFDEGSNGAIVNIGQFLSTGTFWRTEPCTGSQKDNPIGVSSSEAEEALGHETPGYDPDAQCNTRGLTRLGEYAVRGLMKRNMMIEIDHMSVKAANRTFEMAEAENYPGVISSHSWMDTEWTERVYQLGGFVATYPFAPQAFADDLARTAELREKYDVGAGLGLDMNGFGGYSAPEGADAPNAVTYPYRSLDGTDVLDRQVTGERTWDVNTDGLAHYGLAPDWIEKVRRSEGGAAATRDLMRGAQSYLDTWAGSTAHSLGTNLAAGRAARASSSEGGLLTSHAPGNAVDGNPDTRWASDWSDDQWWQVDLGTARPVARVTLDWEAAHAAAYEIQVSGNGTTWTTVWSTDASNGGIDTARFSPVTARYVRMQGVRRATVWGYSLHEVSVHGD